MKSGSEFNEAKRPVVFAHQLQTPGKSIFFCISPSKSITEKAAKNCINCVFLSPANSTFSNTFLPVYREMPQKTHTVYGSC